MSSSRARSHCAELGRRQRSPVATRSVLADPLCWYQSGVRYESTARRATDVEPLRVDDYAESAQSRLPVDVWGYVQGGSGVEWTIAENRAAFDRVVVRPRVLVDVKQCDPGTVLLGAPIPTPIGVAPMAYHRLVHPDGELATALAAGDVGGPFVVSIFASQTLADIAKNATGPLWLQVYWLRRRDALIDLIHRAEAAGFGALVLTVDTPKVARRLRDVRN